MAYTREARQANGRIGGLTRAALCPDASAHSLPGRQAQHQKYVDQVRETLPDLTDEADIERRARQLRRADMIRLAQRANAARAQAAEARRQAAEARREAARKNREASQLDTQLAAVAGERVTVRERVLGHLTGQPDGIITSREATDLYGAAAAVILHYLMKDGTVERIRRGTYRLVTVAAQDVSGDAA